MLCYYLSSANTTIRNINYAFNNNLSLKLLKKIVANDQTKIDQSFAHIKTFEEFKQSICELNEHFIHMVIPSLQGRQRR